MHGIIFHELKQFVEENFGQETCKIIRSIDDHVWKYCSITFWDIHCVCHLSCRTVKVCRGSLAAVQVDSSAMPALERKANVRGPALGKPAR